MNPINTAHAVQKDELERALIAAVTADGSLIVIAAVLAQPLASITVTV